MELGICQEAQSEIDPCLILDVILGGASMSEAKAGRILSRSGRET